jgi:endogenous inhibitor of DNA gyrase (YacG/DUF329 family)
MADQIPRQRGCGKREMCNPARPAYAPGVSSKQNIRCPICGTTSRFFDEPVGPFCSKRCKMVDLGKWLGEEYRISESLRPDHLLEQEESEADRPGERED